jgi:hypothetical protein
VRIDDENNILLYENLNFVAVSFTSPTVNASQMTHVHVDLRVEEPLNAGDSIRLELIDFGPNGSFDGVGSDDSGGSFTVPITEQGTWVSVDIPLSSFTNPTGGGFPGLTSTSNLAQFVFASGGIAGLLVDNIYFYR